MPSVDVAWSTTLIEYNASLQSLAESWKTTPEQAGSTSHAATQIILLGTDWIANIDCYTQKCIQIIDMVQLPRDIGTI